MKEITSLDQLDVNIDLEFRYEFLEYQMRHNIKTFLSKMLCANIKAAYASSKSVKVDKQELYFGAYNVLFMNDNNQWIKLWSSEWAALEYVK